MCVCVLEGGLCGSGCAGGGRCVVSATHGRDNAPVGSDEFPPKGAIDLVSRPNL